MKKVLFVCTANVCRSPMAETIFNAQAEDAGLDFRAESAGVAALVGKPIAPNAGEALGEIGLNADGHRARRVSEAMLEESDLVLVMGPWHAAELRKLFGETAGKIHVLSGYATGAPDGEEIPDPYGYNMTAHRAIVRYLSDLVGLVVERLKG